MVSAGWLRLGGEMLIKVALVLLVLWLVGVLGPFQIGDVVHVLLLTGLALLLLGFLRAREAAVKAAAGTNSPPSQR